MQRNQEDECRIVLGVGCWVLDGFDMRYLICVI